MKLRHLVRYIPHPPLPWVPYETLTLGGELDLTLAQIVMAIRYYRMAGR